MNIDAKIAELQAEYAKQETAKHAAHAQMIAITRKIRQLETVKKHAESIFVDESSVDSLKEITENLK